MANPAFGLDGRGSDDGTSSAGAADTTNGSQSASSADDDGDAEGTATSSASLETGGDDRSSDTTSDTTSDATVADSGVDQTGPSETDVGTMTGDSDSNTTSNMSGDAATSDAMSDDAAGATTGIGMCALAGVTGCDDCMSEACCELLTACNGSSECSCLADCLAGGDPAADCNATCEIAKSPDEWPPLLECVLDNCPDGDECPNAGDG